MTKEELQQYCTSSAEIDRLQERIQTVQNEIYSLRAVIPDDMPKGHKETDRLEHLIDLKQALITEFMAQQKAHHMNMIHIENALMRMDNKKYKTLLSLRYLDNRTWEYIAEYMGYQDVRWIYKLHGRALQSIAHL